MSLWFLENALKFVGLSATIFIGPALLLIGFLYDRALGPVRTARLTLRARRISTAGIAAMFGGIPVICAALALGQLSPD